MIKVPELAGKSVAIMGLGRSGKAAAKALKQSGAEVWAWDDDERKRESLTNFNIIDLANTDLKGIRALILSPGIPHTHPKPHPVAIRARDAGVDIISDIEILVRAQRNASYIAVTGTNGKSTTTALISHILEKNGVPIQVGGNIGVPALELNPVDQQGFYVLEISSYQLELTRSANFDISVLINISEDHLDRHGGLDGYIESKKMIFQGHRGGSSAVIGIDDNICAEMFQKLKEKGRRKVVPISGCRKCPNGVYVLNDLLYDDLEGKCQPIFPLSQIGALTGVHNAQNVAAAYSASRIAGLASQDIIEAVKTFESLPHRQEITAIINGIRYINDSKATNPEATARALACYDAIYWIGGGLENRNSLESIVPYLSRIRRAFLIGESARRMAVEFGDSLSPKLCKNLASAIISAHAEAVKERRRGAVVLLSPACASFDQFENFEERGKEFCRLVAALPGTHQNVLNKGEFN